MRDAPTSTSTCISALAKEQRFIDLWPIPELRGIAADGSTLRLGALTTYSELIQSALVRRRIPMLVAAAREVGGRQIQHRGTIGGNIANASPAGDALPVLAAADATIVLQSATAERKIPLTEFFTGYRQTMRQADELIVGGGDSARSRGDNTGERLARAGPRRYRK